MDKIKYIFCDLDGTLLNDKKSISREQISYLKGLKEKANICFGLATGRALTSVIPIMEETGLNAICDVVVANNGADIYDVKKAQNTVVARVEVEEIRSIVDAFKKYDYINVMFHNPKGMFGLKKTEKLEVVQKANRHKNFYSPLDTEYEPAARVSLVIPPERFQEARELIQTMDLPDTLSGIQSGEDIYDFSKKGISKEEGIESYISRFGDSMKQVIVFGDEENDLGMIRSAGVSVGMKNSSKKVLESVNYITDYTNNEDGIMKFLKIHEELF